MTFTFSTVDVGCMRGHFKFSCRGWSNMPPWSDLQKLSSLTITNWQLMVVRSCAGRMLNIGLQQQQWGLVGGQRGFESESDAFLLLKVHDHQ
jgi:hypothetical protein